jgi:peroxiredoxin
LPVGVTGPDFSNVRATDGRRYSLRDFDRADAIVLIFSSNRCPTAKAYAGRLNDLHDRYARRGVQLVLINSNDPHLYAEESYEAMVERDERRRFNFPYVKDADQSVARAFGAQCTLHAFVLDRERRLRYRGRIDDARNPAKVTTHDLRDAVDDVLAGRPVRVPETAAFGCRLDLA